ncbi:MAG TPA: hypothetical protein VER96_19220 [Polyangiaceae bacterium]|nr:hypothetical protein [Polyangiaceae bacterium]
MGALGGAPVVAGTDAARGDEAGAACGDELGAAFGDELGAAFGDELGVTLGAATRVGGSGNEGAD